MLPDGPAADPAAALAGALAGDWPACTVLLPHALAVLDLTSGGSRDIALAMGSSGRYLAAQELFRQIAAAHEADPPGAAGAGRSRFAYLGQPFRFTSIAEPF